MMLMTTVSMTTAFYDVGLLLRRMRRLQSATSRLCIPHAVVEVHHLSLGHTVTIFSR